MLTGALKPPPSGLFGGMSDHLSNPHGALGDISGVMQDIKMGNHGQFGENLEASSSNIPASIDPPAMRSFHHTMGGSSATAHQRPQAAAHG